MDTAQALNNLSNPLLVDDEEIDKSFTYLYHAEPLNEEEIFTFVNYVDRLGEDVAGFSAYIIAIVEHSDGWPHPRMLLQNNVSSLLNTLKMNALYGGAEIVNPLVFPTNFFPIPLEGTSEYLAPQISKINFAKASIEEIRLILLLISWEEVGDNKFLRVSNDQKKEIQKKLLHVKLTQDENDGLDQVLQADPIL